MCAFAALVVSLLPTRAHAYPWMIRAGSAQCATCHADPSGSGLLTAYGRVKGETLLRFHYGEPGKDTSVGKFVWGASTPSWLLLGGSIRNGYLVQHIKDASTQPEARILQMQADVRAQITMDRVRLNFGIGYLHKAGEATRITTRPGDNLVSREHWIGVDLGEEREWLVRLGRIPLPYGIRGNEHTMWIRSTLRTDINEGQQHGVAASYAAGAHRAEVMLVAGNLQLQPDVYREQGIVGYYEHVFHKRFAAGLSGLALHSTTDVQLRVSSTRQAYGAFLRWAPVRPLVLLFQEDMILQKADGRDLGHGLVGMLQGDLEIVQGLHVMSTSEWRSLPFGVGRSVGQWLSLAWFLAPHTDLRADVIHQVFLGAQSVVADTVLLQMHVYL